MKQEMTHTAGPLSRCRMVDFERHYHVNGTLAVAQNGNTLPFAVKRVFYIYDIPSDTRRGGHSHRVGEQLVVALSGSFEVKLTDGRDELRVTLNRPYKGLYVPAGVWLELSDFSSGCLCLTLCSNNYDEDDYVRDFNEFKNQHV